MSVRRLCLSFPLALALVASAASAQTWSTEQKEVWKVEDLQWQMSKDKDATWMDKLVHPNLSYWDNDQVAPRTQTSLKHWDRYSNSNGTTLEQEIYPISMTITGNIAVAQYRYTAARENYKKERETVSGRYTDILIKDGGQWKFLAWAGGDDPKK